MWLFVMFDLPTGTKKERKQASEFRNSLKDLGFEMSQFSVYLKYCASSEKATAACKRVNRLLPSGGKVDILTITDKQFGAMERFYGRRRDKKSSKPDQLLLF